MAESDVGIATTARPGPADREAAAAARKVAHLTPEQRAARGKAARNDVSRGSHGRWVPADDRADPIALLEQQAATRVPELVPIRYGRMLVSPFTFYRGAALIMAADLAATPRSGLTAQLCGDAHLSNFGVFASPERHLLFDINDFDETLPRPVRMGRQAPDRLLRGRRARPRLHRRAAARHRAGLRGRVPITDGGGSGVAEPGRLVPAHQRGRPRRPARSKAQGQGDQAGAGGDREGPDARQHAGVRQAHPRRRRPAPHHRRSPAHHPDRRPAPRRGASGTRSRTGCDC